MFKKYVLLSLLFFSGLCNAQGWSDALTVKSTMTEGMTDLIIATTEGDTIYTTNCVANQWIFKSDAEDRRNRAYSTLMAAVASGKKVKLWYTDSCSSWNYHEATSVSLHN